MRRARAGIVPALIGVSVLLVGGGAAYWLWPKPAPIVWANDYDLTTTEPELILPGTVVERSAPKGWSHLVIKSLPRVRPSEVSRVPAPLGIGRDIVVRRVSWMFTAFAADVVVEEQGKHSRYRLRAIGLGLGTKVKDEDTVLTVESAEKVGLKLGNFGIDEKTLKKGYEVQKQSRVVVHGPSFALVDTPVTYRCGNKNRMVRFRYGLLVNTQSGQLDVLCWQIGAENGECADLARAALLNPNTIDEAELIPDPKQVDSLGAPNELTFGVDDLPPHRLIVTIPPELRDVAGKTRFTPDEARTLEAGLRKLLP